MGRLTVRHLPATTSPAGILVAGAGPAGLALALQAHVHGAAVRIVDRRPQVFRPSRALIMHARTLEVLRPLGVTQALLARADTAPAVDLHLGGRVVRASLGDLALPDTAFPHLSLVRQMDVERVLTRALADRGISVERGTELAGVRDGRDGVMAVLRSPAEVEEACFGFVAGCDGPGQHRAVSGPHRLAWAFLSGGGRARRRGTRRGVRWRRRPSRGRVGGAGVPVPSR